MAAYSLSLKRHCQRCGKMAAVEVFNVRGAQHGYFCVNCGESEVERLNALAEQQREHLRGA